jgi:hypothetical protein
MILRLVTTPLSPDDATTELKTIAKINGYSEEFVDRNHNKNKEKDEFRNLTTCLKRGDAPTMHHVLSGHREQTTKDLPELSN